MTDEDRVLLEDLKELATVIRSPGGPRPHPLYGELQKKLRHARIMGKIEVVEEFGRFDAALQRGRPDEQAPGSAPDFFNLSPFLDLNRSRVLPLTTRVSEALARASDPIHLFGYRFFAVGQGLFTAGYVTRRGAPPFRWVYDCGSASGVELVRNGLAELRSLFVGKSRPHLDLVVISHFDEDHINGLLDLLGQFSVETLLLPYLDPAQRLEVMLTERTKSDSELLAFLAAPTSFILARDGAEDTTILLTPPANLEDEPASDAGFEPGPEEERREGGSELTYPQMDPPREEDEADATGLKDGRVRMLAPRGQLRLEDFWEFQPYNDAALADRANPEFKRIANKALGTMMRSAQKRRYDRCRQLLAYLKGLYDGRFGSTGRPRNVISLFFYAGPTAWVRSHAALETHEWMELCQSYRFVLSGRFGLLMTGDGYLDSDARVAALQAEFAPARLRRAGVFQVMHHGSRKNFCDRVPGAFDPLASLFSSQPSSDPAKPGHPDREVWDAFLDYHPRQVDKWNDWSLCGAFCLPGRGRALP